jgi:hypothetical protein
MLNEKYRRELRAKLELAALRRDIELATQKELQALRVQIFGPKKAEDMARADAIRRIESRRGS